MKIIYKNIIAQKFSGCLILSVLLFIASGTYAQRKISVAYKDSAVTEFFRRTSGWVAGDGAFSIPLSDGRTLWTMGDSFIDTYDAKTGRIPCLFQVNNAALLQPGKNWDWMRTKTLIGKGPGSKSLFKDPADNKYWYWPVSGIQLGDTVYVYYSSLERASGGLGFASTGKDMLVKIKFPEMEIAGYSPLQNFNGIGFGIGFIKDGNQKYVHVFGTKFNPDTRQNNVYVARFREENPGAPWECWDGAEWNKDMTLAAIVKSTYSTPQVSKVKDKYLLLSTEFSVGCDQGKEIYAYTSSHATGPFSNGKTIYTIDDTLQRHYPFFYVPVAHPQFINGKDEILITYCINGYGTCVQGCVENKMNPDHYRPRGIRVPLKLIDQKL